MGKVFHQNAEIDPLVSGKVKGQMRSTKVVLGSNHLHHQVVLGDFVSTPV